MIVVEDVLRWLSNDSEVTSDSAAMTGDLQRVLDAVVNDVETTCDLPAEYPANVDLAITMATARLWRRKDTPNGLAGLGGDGVIRVGSYDADVEKLLTPFRQFNVG